MVAEIHAQGTNCRDVQLRRMLGQRDIYRGIAITSNMSCDFSGESLGAEAI